MATSAPIVLKSTITPPPAFKSTLSEGPPGAPGPAGGTTFQYTQDVAATVWTVPHNLGRYPSVVVADNLGVVVIADVEYIDNNIVRITHGAPFSGVAYCN